MNLSLRSRLILFLLVPLILLRGLDALYDYYTHVLDLKVIADRRLLDTARMIASGVTAGGSKFDSRTQAILAPLVTEDTIRYSIRGANGALLAGDTALPTLPAASDANPVYSEAMIGATNTPVATYRMNVDGVTTAINVAIGTGSILNVKRAQVWHNLLWDFLELDISVLFIWLAVYFALRPLETLRSELAKRSAHDLGRIDLADRPREIVSLAMGLNRLLETLNGVLNAHQEFISNAAHQLRTPIAGMTAQLDLLNSEAIPTSIKSRLDRLARGMRNLGRTANQLLTLARIDTVAINIRTDKNADLSVVVADVVERHIDRAVQLDIELSVDTQPTQIHADAWMIEELLSNMLDNALKYTPTGGSVVIRCGVKFEFPFLSVEDTGPGIPIAERKRVLQRFYRPPGSSGEGTGLGLSIVDKIARAYRATISIDSGDNGQGVRIEVQWPSAKTEAA